MTKNKKSEGAPSVPSNVGGPAYEEILSGISALLESARHSAARAVNSLMTATY